MDVTELARLQFALTAGFHFLFVALTLGLAPFVAILETRFVISKRPVLERMTRFWGHIYVINYAVGIFVGLALEFQFGLNWAGLSGLVGEVFGVPLAMETLVAFFLESTFLGIWIFGWGRMPRALHAAVFWLVTLTGYVSAYWIMVANGFLQRPVGYVMTEAGAQLTNLRELLLNSAAMIAFLHVVAAALLTGGFLVAGVSAWHLFRRTGEPEFFRRSLRLAMLFAVIGSAGSVGLGFGSMAYLSPYQPLKMAVANGRTEEALGYQAEMVAAHGPGNYLPPSWISGPYAVMQVAGFAFFLLALFCSLLLFKNLIDRWRVLLIPLMIAFPLPFLINLAGWILREVGRQPWVVYEVLLVDDAVSSMSSGTMTASLAAFTVVFAVLAVVDWALIARVAKRGPRRPSFGMTLAEAEEDPPPLVLQPEPSDSGRS